MNEQQMPRWSDHPSNVWGDAVTVIVSGDFTEGATTLGRMVVMDEARGSVVSDHEAIVRELAEGGPFLGLDYEGTLGCSICGSDRPPLEDPAAHADTCLWRRAKAIYPDH